MMFHVETELIRLGTAAPGGLRISCQTDAEGDGSSVPVTGLMVIGQHPD